MLLSFIFGTERSVILKICKWWWLGRWRQSSLSVLRLILFKLFFFSDKKLSKRKRNQNRLFRYKNFYFLLTIFKNRLKWIKNPSLHDSRPHNRWNIPEIEQTTFLQNWWQNADYLSSLVCMQTKSTIGISEALQTNFCRGRIKLLGY